MSCGLDRQAWDQWATGLVPVLLDWRERLQAVGAAKGGQRVIVERASAKSPSRPSAKKAPVALHARATELSSDYTYI